LHTPLLQSVPTAQPLPSLHLLQTSPQSTSVSVGVLRLSVHVAGAGPPSTGMITPPSSVVVGGVSESLELHAMTGAHAAPTRTSARTVKERSKLRMESSRGR